MANVAGEIVIRRRIEEVFDFVADERHEPQYNPNMIVSEKLTEGPIGVGTRFRAEIMNRSKPLQMQIEYTAFERPRRLASVTTSPIMETDGTLTFEPVAEGTRMRWSWIVKPRGLLKLMTPVVGHIGRRQERAIWTELKRVLEPEDRRVHA